jgi:hypothetical protein
VLFDHSCADRPALHPDPAVVRYHAIMMMLLLRI